MRKIFLHPYELQMVDNGQKRQGYLLKMQSSEFWEGYADIFPWPQFGDPSFSEIPDKLKRGAWEPLLQRSLFFAKKDGLARERGESLLPESGLRNHFLLLSLEKWRDIDWPSVFAKDFRRIKIKIGEVTDEDVRQLEGLTTILPPGVRLRFDMNERGSTKLLDRLLPFSDWIEFVEDPSSKEEVWQHSLPLAYDQPSVGQEFVPFDWQVVKPAKQAQPIKSNKHIIFTSYMDHPVGIAHAFAEAFEYGPQKHDYGLMSHDVYQETPFHKELMVDGATLSFPKDVGIGFSKLLSSLPWEPLC